MHCWMGQTDPGRSIVADMSAVPERAGMGVGDGLRKMNGKILTYVCAILSSAEIVT